MKVHLIRDFYNINKTAPTQRQTHRQNVASDSFCCSKPQPKEYATVSFKENSLPSLFNKEPKDKIITKEEVLLRFKQAKIKSPELLTDSVICSEGYSETLTNKIIELHSMTKSAKYTKKIFRFCTQDGKLDQKAFDDIKDCFDKKISTENIWAIFRAATYFGRTKYNPEVKKFAEENRGKCNANKFAEFLRASSNKDTYKFSKEHFLTLLDISKNYGFTNENISDVPFLYNFYKEEVTKEAAKQIKEMQKLGLSPYKISQILATCGLKPSAELLKSITKNIPDIEDKKQLYQFLENRISECKKTVIGVGLIPEEKEPTLDKSAFDFYNELYQKHIEKGKTVLFFDLAAAARKMKNIKGNKAKKQFKDFSFEALDCINLSIINKIARDVPPCDYDKLLYLYRILDQKDKADIETISQKLHSLSNKKMLKIFEDLYPVAKDKKDAAGLMRLIENSFKSYHDKQPNQTKLDYVIDNIEHPTENILLEMGFINEKGIDKNKIEILRTLIENGFSVQDLTYDKLTKRGLWNEEDITDKILNNKDWVEITAKLKKANIINRYIYNYLENELSLDEVDKLLNIRHEAIEHRNVLQLYGTSVTKSKINTTFLEHPNRTLNALKILGEKSFVQIFPKGIDYVSDIINNIGIYPIEKESNAPQKIQDAYQKLIEITNPTESEIYIKLDTELKELKKKFPQTEEPEQKQELINSINDITRRKNELIQNSIKDHYDKLYCALVFFAVLFANIEDRDNPKPKKFYKECEKNLHKIDKILPYLNYKTEKEKEKYTKVLSGLIGDLYLGKTLSPETNKKLNLENCKYLPMLFCPDNDFIQSFSVLLQILEKNKHESTLDALNSLEENIKTKKIFKRYGLDYNSWVEFNPNSKLSVTVKIDSKQIKQNVLRNIEADFNDVAFQSIPIEEKEKLFSAIKKEGFEIRMENGVVYDENGTLTDRSNAKLYKNSKPITFNDVHKIIDVIKKEMNQNEFWNTDNDNDDIDVAKETIKNHILKMRYQEVKQAEAKHCDCEKHLSIQKADMNDISHALFLGNDAGCCTAVGTGCNMWTAPTYIKDKFVSCIEVKDGDRFVGNTMIYAAIIDGSPALILDNIELKAEYQYIDEIREGIFDYAQQIAKEIGRPDMKIYAGPNRHKVNMNQYSLDEYQTDILGYGAENEDVYIDFIPFIEDIEYGNPKIQELFLVR